METIFVPALPPNKQIAELDFNEILNLIKGEPGERNIVNLHQREVNIGNNRYHLLKKNPKCACCGIQANRCFLEHDLQNGGFLISFYAESASPSSEKIHFIVMTKDHIIARCNGGSDEIDNLQTLCFNCNHFKNASDLTIDQMKVALFSAYRAYKSSMAITKSQPALEKLRYRLQGIQKRIKDISQALKLVNGKQIDTLQARLNKFQTEYHELKNKIETIELQAQITGVVYNPDDN